MKLLSKSRDGAKVKKRYDKPKTPFQRVVEDPTVGQMIKSRLRAQLRALNPIEMKWKIVDIQERLEAIATAKAKVKQFSNPPHRKSGRQGKTAMNSGLGRNCLKNVVAHKEVVPGGHPPLLRGGGFRRVMRRIVWIDFIVRQRIPFGIDFQIRQ
jgi:hypothetical protein